MKMSHVEAKLGQPWMKIGMKSWFYRYVSDCCRQAETKDEQQNGSQHLPDKDPSAARHCLLLDLCASHHVTSASRSIALDSIIDLWGVMLLIAGNFLRMPIIDLRQ